MSNSINDLRKAIKDPEQRIILTEIPALSLLLTDCIIEKNYRLSDDWIRPIRFTALGQKIIDGCSNQYKRLKPNDLKMAVFLTIGCADGLMVDLTTDIDGLRQQMSREIINGHIRYPYIFGRELHDAAAELFPASTKLNNDQTIAVLNKLPIGVFQQGRTVVGPYGCTYSDTTRQAGPSLSVPGYRCTQESCTTVHDIRLSTADGSISKARRQLRLYMEKNCSQSADEYVPLLRRAAILDQLPIHNFPSNNLIDVLSDGLSEAELRSVIDHLFRTTFKRESRRLDISRRLHVVIANPSDFVAQLERPQLMQIALLHADADIIGAIDETISQAELQVQDFEVRVSRVKRWDHASRYPHAEIGALGARFTSSPNSRMVATRMLHLLHTEYYESEFWDAGDLAYAIEAPNGLSDGELLDRAIRDHSVRELFTKLILPNRRTVSIACRELDLFNQEGLPREQLLERLQWKVGEPSTIGFSDLRKIDEHLAKVRLANSEGQAPDLIRSAASILFPAVEEALNRALTFSTWILSTDHYLSEDGFVYDPLLDRSILSFIEAHAPAGEPELELRTDRGNTLAPLGAGFTRLAKALRNLNEELSLRAEKDIPAQCTAGFQPFAFPFTRMYLNLAESAKSDVLTALQAIGRHAQNNDVIDARNWTAHGDKAFPGSERIANALDHVAELRVHLRATGLYPRLYELVSLVRDGLGREQLTYKSEGELLTIFRPGWAFAPKLPSGQARLILVPVANTGSSGPLRFRLKPRPGGDPYWDGWQHQGL